MVMMCVRNVEEVKKDKRKRRIGREFKMKEMKRKRNVKRT
jgi:hypothetical protein